MASVPVILMVLAVVLLALAAFKIAPEPARLRRWRAYQVTPAHPHGWYCAMQTPANRWFVCAQCGLMIAWCAALGTRVPPSDYPR